MCQDLRWGHKKSLLAVMQDQSQYNNPKTMCYWKSLDWPALLHKSIVKADPDLVEAGRIMDPRGRCQSLPATVILESSCTTEPTGSTLHPRQPSRSVQPDKYLRGAQADDPTTGRAAAKT